MGILCAIYCHSQGGDIVAALSQQQQYLIRQRAGTPEGQKPI